jgi:hypothetical protein
MTILVMCGVEVTDRQSSPNGWFQNENYMFLLNSAQWAKLNVFQNKNGDGWWVILWNTGSILDLILMSNWAGFRGEWHVSMKFSITQHY